jgi:hypothetical protein
VAQWVLCPWEVDSLALLLTICLLTSFVLAIIFVSPAALITSPHAVTQCRGSRGSARGTSGTLAKRQLQLFSIKRQGSRPVCQMALDPSYQRGGEAFLLQRTQLQSRTPHCLSSIRCCHYWSHPGSRIGLRLEAADAAWTSQYEQRIRNH